MEALVWLGIGSLIGYAATQRSGDPPLKGVLVGALLGPLLAPLMFLAKPAKGQQRRKCPSCDEWISAAAKVCPKCQREVPQTAPRPLGYGSPTRR